MKNKIFKRITGFTMASVLMLGLLTGCGNAAKDMTTEQKIMESQASESQTTQSQSTDVTTEMSEISQTDSEQSDAAASLDGEITVTDQIGREVKLKNPAQKIVSSYYISTAIAVALGLEDQLTGIEMKGETRELYKKAAPGLLELPAVGSGKGINIEETASLNPDVVILPKKLKDSVAQFEKLGIPVLVVDPETLENYMDCVTLIGKAAGVNEKAEELNAYYQEKMDFVNNLTKDLTERPTVYLSSGSSYLSTCSSQMYQSDLITMAGGQNVSAELTDGYWAEVSPEQILSWNPQYMFAVSYAEYKLEDIANEVKLSEVQAVKDGKLFTFPSNIEPWDYPTPSSVLGILWLTHVLHPDLYTEDTYVKEAKEFYNRFFDIQVEDTDLGL